MNYFDQHYNETEIAARMLSEQKAKVVYDSLDQKYNVGNILVTPPGTDYISRVQSMLLDPYLRPIHAKCLEELIRNGADMKSFLFSFINVLLLPNIPYDVASAIVKIINTLDIYDSFAISKSSIDVTTLDGSMHLSRVDEWLRDNYKLAVDRNGYAGNCHSVTQKLASYFPDYYATTVKIPAYFGGNFYHSFFSSPNNDLVVDFSIGEVVKKGDFYSVIGCDEILNIPNLDIDNAYNDLCQTEDVPNDMCPLLALAIDKERSR